MSALGQKPTYALQQAMSALHPIATAKADFPQTVMSALPPKADMCSATGDVCYGPKAEVKHFATNASQRPSRSETSACWQRGERLALL
jgi:hypothetical protein